MQQILTNTEFTNCLGWNKYNLAAKALPQLCHNFVLHKYPDSIFNFIKNMLNASILPASVSLIFHWCRSHNIKTNYQILNSIIRSTFFSVCSYVFITNKTLRNLLCHKKYVTEMHTVQNLSLLFTEHSMQYLYCRCFQMWFYSSDLFAVFTYTSKQYYANISQDST